MVVQSKSGKTESGTRMNKQPEQRRREILICARDLFETRGIARTSVQDITNATGVTRSLFYYYFSDKDALVEAVLDYYTDDFAAKFAAWDSQRVPGDIEGALRSCVRMIREQLFDADSFRHSLRLDSNARLWSMFVDRTVTKIADAVNRSTVSDYATQHTIQIDYVYETFVMLIYGLIQLIRSQPDISDDTLMKIIVQTLHMEDTVKL